MLKKFKNFLIELFFPAHCFSCQKEGSYLCPDCQSILEVFNFHRPENLQELSDLYFATSYQKPLVQKLIKQFKYEPFFIKKLAKPLSLLIMEHLQLLDNNPDFNDFVLIPVPLAKKRLKWRGFNQAEEIAKELAKLLNLEILNNVLIKTSQTLSQAELAKEKRKENVKGTFKCLFPKKIKKRKILLVDDVFTTGSTLTECARTLKESGAEKIIGLVVARD